MAKPIRPEITPDTIAALPVWGRLLAQKPAGFGVRRTPAGASYFFRWRAREDGKLRDIGLGRVCDITITNARRKADEYRGQLALRIDPLDAIREEQAAKRNAKAATDAAEAAAAARLTLATFAPIYAAAVRKKDSSRRSDASIFWLHILPRLGAKPVEEINRLDAQRLHDALATTPTRANRAFALLSHMLTVAAAKGYREGPLPRACIKKNAEPARDRYLTPTEHATLWKVLTAMEATPHRDSAQALKVLIATGCRKNEIVHLAWNEVDIEAACLRLADSKTGRRTVPLVPGALAIIKAREPGHRSAFVFPSEDIKRPRADVEVAWRLARDAAKLPGVRIHDLRHSFAAACVAEGLTLTEIGSLLGHKAAATTARYAHVSDAVARSAADRVGVRLASIVAAADGLKAVKK